MFVFKISSEEDEEEIEEEVIDNSSDYGENGW